MSVWKRKDTKKNPWQARWSDKDGKEHTKHFPTKAQAVTFEAKMLNEVSQGYFSDPLHAKTKLSNVYADWLPSTLNLKPKTRASYLSLWKCLVEPYWGNRQLQTITRSDIKIWVIASKSSTGKIVSPSRMKQAYVLLKLLLDHAVDMNLIGRSPILSGSKTNLKSLLPKNSMQSERRVLENIELRKLAEEVGEYAPLILLAGLVGLRWAELVALTPADLDFKTQTISVNKSVTEVDGKFEIVSTKTGQARILPMPAYLIPDLRQLAISRSMNAPIFQAPRGGYIRHSNFNRRIFRPALAALGINNFTFHSLRHTAISHAIASGADVIAVSKIAGHANPAITLNVYGHLLNNSLENFRNAIDVNFALASSN